MPREMTRMTADPVFGGLGATRWTSTSAHATLKAPHGGMGSLGCGCGCGSCGQRGQLNGLSGCGCGGSRRSSTRLTGLGAVAPTKTVQFDPLKISGRGGAFLGGEVRPLTSGQEQVVQIELYMLGQPPVGYLGVVDQANKAMIMQSMADVQISPAKVYPLAWSWAYDSKDKAWTAYVSNADAGPFRTLLDVQRSYHMVFDTPTAEDTKNLPTNGIYVLVQGTRPSELTLDARTNVINAFEKGIRALPGTDLFFTTKFFGQKKAGSGFWGVLGLLALGGVAYYGGKGP